MDRPRPEARTPAWVRRADRALSVSAAALDMAVLLAGAAERYHLSLALKIGAAAARRLRACLPAAGRRGGD
jgi:hypothetical protein